MELLIGAIIYAIAFGLVIASFSLSLVLAMLPVVVYFQVKNLRRQVESLESRLSVMQSLERRVIALEKRSRST